MSDTTVVLVADPHIGADKFGASPDEWDAPLKEAADWAGDNQADAFIVAGDLFHRRNPTTEEYARATRILEPLIASGIDVLVVAGNHDLKATRDSEPASWPWNTAVGEAAFRVVGYHDRKVSVLCLPWPRPVDYLTPRIGEGIAEELARTRDAVLERLRSPYRPAGPRILVGHAMVSYGTHMPQGPGLLLGKDVVLPFEELRAICPQIFLGHVHDPRQQGYIGSTQPTDWGEADQQKGFQVYRASLIQSVERIAYKTSLRLFSADENTEFPFLDDYMYDAGRIIIHGKEGVRLPTHAEALDLIAPHCRRVLDVQVIPYQPERRRADVAAASKEARPDLSDIPQAVRAWTGARALSPDATAAVMARLEVLSRAP